MANARDIIPIALAGLGGLLGGRPTAGAITNAAQISRAGRLDKQRKEQLAISNARSARSLELSEEAAKRAQKGLDIAQSREKRYAAAEEERNKAREEERGHAAAWSQSWQEAHPDAEPFWTNLAGMVEDKGDIIKFETEYKRQTGRPTSKEAAATARSMGLGPGERISIQVEGGGTFSAVGATSEGQGIPEYQIQNRFKDGEREFKRDMDRERVEIAKEQDAINKMMSDEDVGNDKEASERNRQLMERREMFEYDFSQGPWGHIRRELGSLGLSQQGMAEMEHGYHQAIQERETMRQEQATSARQLSESEIDIVGRARREREAAGLPVAEEAIPEEMPQDGLTPLGRTIAGGAESAWEGWKKAVNTARETYGMKPRRSHER